MGTKTTLLICFLFCIPAFAEGAPCIQPGQGHFQIHVGTAGVFGAFGHDHLIEAQKIEGCASIDARVPTHSSIKLSVATGSLRVIDPGESEKDRATIQKNMETEVLRTPEFPQVTFESSSVAKVGPNQYRVHGALTIRGKTQQVVVPVTFTGQDGAYKAVGEYKLKQTEYGIRPIQIGGGTVKVKDELQITFELYLK